MSAIRTASFANPAPAGIAFDVTAPSGPVFASVSVAVNGKPAWAPDSVALTQDASGHWRGSLATKGPIEWKATRGDWSSVEKTATFDEVANRTSGTANVARWADETSELHDLGDFTPQKLGTPRKVVVRLPVGYALHPNDAYPVLLVLDGQNVFDPARSFNGVSWGLDLAGDAHDRAGRGEFIAVAIDNTAQRIDEYTPDADPQYGGGRLEDLASFLTDELLPRIDASFRTRTGPDDRGILGSSLGGLAAFHTGWKHPDRIRRIGAVSPSFWWNNESTRALVAATATAPPLRLWISVGTNEGSDPQQTLDQVRAVAALCPFAQEWEFPGGTHDEGSWSAQLPQIIDYLFP